MCEDKWYKENEETTTKMVGNQGNNTINVGNNNSKRYSGIFRPRPTNQFMREHRVDNRKKKKKKEKKTCTV